MKELTVRHFRLEDKVYRKLKILSAQRGETLGEVIAAALKTL